MKKYTLIILYLLIILNLGFFIFQNKGNLAPGIQTIKNYWCLFKCSPREIIGKIDFSERHYNFDVKDRQYEEYESGFVETDNTDQKGNVSGKVFYLRGNPQTIVFPRNMVVDNYLTAQETLVVLDLKTGKFARTLHTPGSGGLYGSREPLIRTQKEVNKYLEPMKGRQHSNCRSGGINCREYTNDPVKMGQCCGQAYEFQDKLEHIQKVSSGSLTNVRICADIVRESLTPGVEIPEEQRTWGKRCFTIDPNFRVLNYWERRKNPGFALEEISIKFDYKNVPNLTQEINRVRTELSKFPYYCAQETRSYLERESYFCRIEDFAKWVEARYMIIPKFNIEE